MGSDYSCHPVWEKYIAFETALGAYQRAAALYGRALQTPLKGLDALLAQCVFSYPGLTARIYLIRLRWKLNLLQG